MRTSRSITKQTHTTRTYTPLTAAERAQLTPEDIARMDAEDRQYDPPGEDWDAFIAQTLEDEKEEGAFTSLEEFARVCLEDLDKIEKMTPEELDGVIARGGRL